MPLSDHPISQIFLSTSLGWTKLRHYLLPLLEKLFPTMKLRLLLAFSTCVSMTSILLYAAPIDSSHTSASKFPLLEAPISSSFASPAGEQDTVLTRRSPGFFYNMYARARGFLATNKAWINSASERRENVNSYRKDLKILREKNGGKMPVEKYYERTKVFTNEAVAIKQETIDIGKATRESLLSEAARKKKVRKERRKGKS